MRPPWLAETAQGTFLDWSQMGGGVGKKKEIESNSLGSASKWLDTEVIWEPCRK